MSGEAQQTYVVSLVDRIMAVIAGEETAEACTALTIAVACQIVATESGGVDERLVQVQNFARQLQGFVERDDIVDWIKSSIRPVTPVSRKQQ